MTLTLLKRMAILTTLLALCVVALGAYTRLKDAGLGCPDWPGCYGFLTVPESASELKIAEARFPHAPVEIEKGWPEMIHRYFASLLGLLIVIQAVFCYRYRRHAASQHQDSVPLKLPMLLVALVICQGLFGMWTVTLKLWPQVVSGHLLGGFATLSLLLLHTLRVHRATPPPLARDANISSELPLLGGLFKWTALGILLVVGQIFLGAWTASNYAALACPDFPTCQGEWWPPMDFANGFNLTQSIGPNYLGGLMDNNSRVAIHVSHRLGALVLTFYLLWMLWRVWRVSATAMATQPLRTRPLRWAAGLVLVALLLQLTLGVINVLWLIPLPIAVAHNAGGAALLLTMVYLNYQLYLACLNRLPAAQTLTAVPTITTTPNYAENCEATS